MMNRVLVIDDEEDVRDLVKTVLVGNGYEVITAGTGEDGLVKAVKTKPDLIILDLVMPGISGLEVCRLLKSKSEFDDVPIIVMSVLDRDIDHEYVQKAGADEFLHKPFNIDEILLTLDRLQRSKHDNKA
jgi:DNA-binding response OmpR family regulator